ncbi:MAG: hypothetical protein KTM48_01080, partial [Wolbachia endosymbiont of Pissodes strobi]|nr:hypothetical protein [Wolbachia endosymbiont of Pissodes strobi]
IQGVPFLKKYQSDPLALLFDVQLFFAEHIRIRGRKLHKMAISVFLYKSTGKLKKIALSSPCWITLFNGFGATTVIDLTRLPARMIYNSPNARGRIRYCFPAVLRYYDFTSSWWR